MPHRGSSGQAYCLVLTSSSSLLLLRMQRCLKPLGIAEPAGISQPLGIAKLLGIAMTLGIPDKAVELMNLEAPSALMIPLVALHRLIPFCYAATHVLPMLNLRTRREVQDLDLDLAPGRAESSNHDLELAYP